MKIERLPPPAKKNAYPQTDIDDLESIGEERRGSFRKGRSRKLRRSRETVQPLPEQIRLFRFNLGQSGKTLRVPCFREQLLNLPLRFTRKLNAMAGDNDVETDEEVALGEVQRCTDWLVEAVQQQKPTSKPQ